MDGSDRHDAWAVTCIVPALNEADRIAETVKHLYEIPGVDRVVVVDDGSSDTTTEAALGAGAVVLVRRRNGGKGGAVDGALSRSVQPDTDIFLLIDGDVGASASTAAALVEAVASGLADIAIGRLPRPVAGGFGLVKRMAA